MKLQLEMQEGIADKSRTPIPGIMMTPPLSDDYWLFRVKLSNDQAIIGFPKFGTIGIGFRKEEDWNTNLPFPCTPERIFSHIADNKGDDNISDLDCVEAIRMIRDAAKMHLGMTDERFAAQVAKVA